MQKLILIGHLGKDPETRYTGSGSAVVSFSVATSERWKDRQSGEQQERTTWHNIEAWGRTAEVCQEYLHKGDLVYIEGKIRNEEWEKDGQKKYMTKVRVDTVQFLNTKGGESAGGGQQQYRNDGPSQQQGQQQQSQNAPANAPAGGPPDDDNFDDDIPF
jgi:single-strand DNA-binding protein